MTNTTVSPNETDHENSANVLVEGDLSLNKLQTTKDELAKALEDYRELNVEIKNVTDFDLASIQVLYSLNHTARELGKTVHLTLELPPELETLVKNSGFEYIEQLFEKE